MILRAALSFGLVSFLAGCVSSGGSNPMATDKGRDEARDAYVDSGEAESAISAALAAAGFTLT